MRHRLDRPAVPEDGSRYSGVLVCVCRGKIGQGSLHTTQGLLALPHAYRLVHQLPRPLVFTRVAGEQARRGVPTRGGEYL